MTEQRKHVAEIESVTSNPYGVNLQQKLIEVYAQFDTVKTEKIKGEYGKWKETHDVAMKLIKLQEVLAKKDGYRSSEAQQLVDEINATHDQPHLDLPLDKKKKMDPAKVQELTRIVSSHYDLITSKMTEVSKHIQHDMQQLDMLSSLFSHQRSEIETILSHMRN